MFDAEKAKAQYLKLVGDISETTGFIFDFTVEQVKNFCNTDEIDERLTHTVIQMAADIYMDSALRGQKTSVPGVNSLSEGSMSVSFLSPDLRSNADRVIKRYASSLCRFRKVEW